MFNEQGPGGASHANGSRRVSLDTLARTGNGKIVAEHARLGSKSPAACSARCVMNAAPGSNAYAVIPSALFSYVGTK
jgi:hypothetical protein